MFAWCLTLSQGLPAEATQPTSLPDLPSVDTTQLQPQSLVAGGEIDRIERDSFTVTAPPPPPPPPTSSGRSSFAGLGMAYVNVSTSEVQWPLAASPISSGFGARTAPCRGCSSNHKGLDFTPGSGTPISAMAAGTVRQIRSDRDGLGTHVIIDHRIGGELVTTVYAHMQAGSVPLFEGETVSVGTTVGRVGNTGASTGAHLHFEIHRQGVQVDPYSWLVSNVR